MVTAWMDRAGWVSLRPVMVGPAPVPALDGGNDAPPPREGLALARAQDASVE
jgi:hypothetical protein